MIWARRTEALTVCWEAVNSGLRGEVSTPSFSWSPARRLLTHRLASERLDNDLGDRIAAELVRPGLVRDFEAAFAGVVTSTAADPLDAWERFYAQTLAGLADGDRPADGGAIATFGAIYRHALSLVVGDSLLDAGSCFGFFCLLAAAQRPDLRVAGSDVSAPTVALAMRMAARLGRFPPTGRDTSEDHDRAHAHAARPVRFAVADVRAGLPSRGDTVTALHVLEHLEPHQFPVALQRLCAAARRRVVIAVPLESVADPTYGHRAAFADLAALRAAATEAAGPAGWHADVHEHRGGWLVLDRLGVAARSGDRGQTQPLTLAHHAGAGGSGQQHVIG